MLISPTLESSLISWKFSLEIVGVRLPLVTCTGDPIKLTRLYNQTFQTSWTVFKELLWLRNLPRWRARLQMPNEVEWKWGPMGEWQ